MDDGDSENYLNGNVNRRLIFSSQLSQGMESSQRGNPIISENSIEKSLDVRLLSQMDFYTPAFTEDASSQLFESVRDSNENSFIYGETPQKTPRQGARSLFKRKIGMDLTQPESKKMNMIPLAQQEDERMTVATLPAPEENPYLLLPDDLNAALQKLLEKRDFSILDESRITRYQREFKELQRLGKGISSTVTLCKHRLDGCYYAIKQIGLSEAMKEVQLLSVMSWDPNEAPHVIRYFGCWKEDDYFFIQLEYGFYGSVSKFAERVFVSLVPDFKNRFTEEDIGELLWQISNALLWLHSHGYAHLDVKPDNILILHKREAGDKKSEWNFKLTDFGLTCKVDNEIPSEGDCRYLPPEILTRDSAFKADVFALGVTVIHLLSPRTCVEKKEFFANVRSGRIPNECREMINVSVADRFTMDQVVHHVYFDSYRK
ncbi:WEE1-like protein kinase [Blastocystis sp. subtype 4]|uniref:WEE1-like protein kinase n=1 Tax=Blastocystis sp. subtype 4 TaxID=944170 RepID=UPI000711F4FE|nr:WEE1-like protein kinase [Blastocystis sp. subtype 4]KNB45922.1 WEE1-like protein kinase [Blastocystis sp. subtype 4]|eukprot:XP_014529365.1 WEE1-like protein kinase [Blastocystis sp. subtype 4]